MTESSKALDTTELRDWRPVVDQAIAGDCGAYARLARLVTGHLIHWRAYDFQSDWDDMVQDVLLSVIRAHREGRLDDPGALQAYLRQATRFKFIDRIRILQRRGRATSVEENEESGESDAEWPPSEESVFAPPAEVAITLQRAIAALPERERASVYEIHVLGRTYEEAAESTGIPLGSLKRALRVGLAALRESLDGAF